MAHLHMRELAAEVQGQALHHVHRAVLAAGAADGDGDVAAVILAEFRQPL